METHLPKHSTRVGTWGGTAVVLWVQIGSAELLKTAILAAVGAAVSFGVSMALKWVVRPHSPAVTRGLRASCFLLAVMLCSRQSSPAVDKSDCRFFDIWQPLIVVC